MKKQLLLSISLKRFRIIQSRFLSTGLFLLLTQYPLYNVAVQNDS